jgi:TRAP-type mannitol/chloroaromatic compound transport system permease large subunit
MTEALAGLPLPPLGTLLLVMVVIFLLGWPFEWPAIVFVFVPLLLLFVPAIALWFPHWLYGP